MELTMRCDRFDAPLPHLVRLISAAHLPVTLFGQGTLDRKVSLPSRHKTDRSSII